MTRILQIRRGTSAQNDNFTGLNGEITMDTTNKTVRIHDGETLGGIALARKDEISPVEPFDINSVSAEFWTALFETYQTGGVKSESSDLYPLNTNVNFYDNGFVYNSMPAFAQAVLVCQSPEAGYSIDDEVCAFGIGNFDSPKMNIFIENSILHVRMFVNAQTFWVCDKTTGVKTNITNANWKIKFIIYY